MLTPEEFRTWCQRLQLPQETEAVISTIRNAQPVRKVKGRVGNVAGRYPSPKMGRSIQFKSRHVELWAIYGMERDDDVLEYYDQSAKIPLSYRAKSGRATTQWHAADFFVLRQGSAGWEEWKGASSLDELALTMQGHYQHTPAGPWRCPPGETYAARLGLTYRVRSSAEYHPFYIQNLKVLQDFWAHPVMLSKKIGERGMMVLDGTISRLSLPLLQINARSDTDPLQSFSLPEEARDPHPAAEPCNILMGGVALCALYPSWQAPLR